jgi:hypothetical protein
MRETAMRVIGRFTWPIALAPLFLACLVLLVSPIVSIPFLIPKDWNEGFYAFAQMRAVGAEPLYPDVAGLEINAYPPLSFYVIGAIGSFVGDHIVAGRVVSLLGFLVVAAGIGMIVHRICRCRYPALFSSMLFVAAITLYHTHYVGMNDPQWLAEAIMVVSAYLLITRPEREAIRIAAMALMLVAGLMKHNIVALPLAATVWVFLDDRRRFHTWMTWATLGLLGALICLYVAYGANFFRSLLQTHSEYSYLRALVSLRTWLTPFAGMLGAFIVYVLIEPPSSHKRLLVLYITFAGAWGLYTSGVFGMDMNHIYDLIIGLTIATGVVVSRVGERLAAIWPRSAVESCLGLVLSVFALLALPTKLVEARWAWSNAQIKETAVSKVIRYLSAQEGPVLCETMALCYWAGKANDGDILVLNKQLRTGTMSESAFRHLVDTHHFKVIQLQDKGPTGRTGRLPEAANDYILERYAVVPNEVGGAFLIPREQK